MQFLNADIECPDVRCPDQDMQRYADVRGEDVLSLFFLKNPMLRLHGLGVISLRPPKNSHPDGCATFFRCYPPVSSNMAMGNPMYMEVSVGKSPTNGPFSIAMFDYQRVIQNDNFFSGRYLRS